MNQRYSYDRRKAYTDTRGISESLREVRKAATPLLKAAEDMRLAVSGYLRAAGHFEHHDEEAMWELANPEFIKELERHTGAIAAAEKLANFILKFNPHEPR